jgi:acetylornithine/N-succinyldiaminopimelate aminotransferase
MPTYPSPPVTFVRGEGSYLFDGDGRRYLDCLSGLAVTSLGHAHPAVAAALHHQASTLLHVSNLFGTEPGPDVARTLDRLVGDGEPAGGQVFFCNSGAEANECAIKLARRVGRGRANAGPGPRHALRSHGRSGRGSGRNTPKPERPGAGGAKSREHVRSRHVVVSAYGSFHGRTLATLHATGQPAKHEPFQPLPEGFRHVAWDDLDALAAALDPGVAAVLLEAVQGEGGVHPASRAYFQGVRRLCDERGVLLIVDEVQTGLGRTGRWFGFQHLGVRPDVVTMAKALGNGVPIGACWARADVASVFEPGDHATTFGGQPLATAAARAVLAVMQAEDVPERAARAGVRFRERLEVLPSVAGVRGLGLLLAVELSGRDARDVNGTLLDAGLVANAVTPTALRLAPSLLISDDEIDEATTIIEKVLQ